MQKLSGNSLDIFYKSCSTIHQESNKIGFEFLCFFYNFLRILQDSAKWLYYLRFTFATRPWQFWFLTKIPSVHTKHPEKKEGVAVWPLGMVAGGSGQNSGEEHASEGRGRVEDGPGPTTGRFVVEVRTEGRLVVRLGDADQRQPRDCWLRRGGGSVGKVSKLASYSVDGVFWYTKHVHYTLVWIYLWN
jgi:hypothetical protein